ncbi:MAG: hypothetical protein KDB84_11330, partial [Flavobacteriales bacterium]|nr:hypothetical protein [Flavobacteriales bacterium]
AHEMGHWGGLLHTFGNTSNSGVTCDDDLIADTPPTAGSVVGSCDIGLSDCTPGVVENVQNHMDYSTCGIMFTEGQADHVVAVMMDPSLVRAAVHSATNLAACGVGMEPGCTIMPDMHWRIQEQCSGTLVDLRAIAEHQVPDSVRWTFADGIPTTSTSDSPQVTYLTTGIHSVELKVCKDGTCTTIQRDIDLNVPDAGSNGLALISSFPFSEDFENGFSLPRPNMMVHSTSHPTWQPCSLAGHESANSLYVPSVSTITAQDTSVLVIGNFDFTGLQQPTIQFNVSTSSYTFANWCWLDVLFKDLCSSIFVGDVWATRGLNEMAGDNGPGFIPTEAGQWTTVTVTFPSWNMAGSAELGIRLRRPANAQNGHTVEHFFLDDLYVG